MSRSDLHASMVDAMAEVVLARVRNYVQSMLPDTSATASEHIIGYKAGFRTAQRRMLELLDGETP